MKTYIIEEWITTWKDTKEIEADRMDVKYRVTLLFKNGEIIATIPSNKMVFLKKDDAKPNN